MQLRAEPLFKLYLIRKFKFNGGLKIKIKEFQVTEERWSCKKVGLKSRAELNHGRFTPESDADVVIEGFRRLSSRNPIRKEVESRRNFKIVTFGGSIEKSTKFRFSFKQR